MKKLIMSFLVILISAFCASSALSAENTNVSISAFSGDWHGGELAVQKPFGNSFGEFKLSGADDGDGDSYFSADLVFGTEVFKNVSVFGGLTGGCRDGLGERDYFNYVGIKVGAMLEVGPVYVKGWDTIAPPATKSTDYYYVAPAVEAGVKISENFSFAVRATGERRGINDRRVSFKETHIVGMVSFKF
ncbi:hypothetical protein K9N08_01470 [Candidatus Gracilibacteria bacterium]|nr:hypothetical protein [Candidatus Gracilibacteria bacterium]MCF7856210.1 hypothetical protein [Candidatus Gracilibacteria bacterium]MCF7896482.1 hypothetical protein [Candidatus Gracilibacteria bacterium]